MTTTHDRKIDQAVLNEFMGRFVQTNAAAQVPPVISGDRLRVSRTLDSIGPCIRRAIKTALNIVYEVRPMTTARQRDRSPVPGVPGHRRPSRPQRFAAGLALVLALWLAGCAGGQVSGGEPPTATSSPALPSPSASAAARSVPFGETFDFGDGVSVEITSVEERALGISDYTDSPDAQPGEPFLIFAATITNQSAAEVELLVTAEASYGTGSIKAYEVGLGDEWPPSVAPKAKSPWLCGFLIPADEHDHVVLQVNVTLDPKRTAVFSGPVSTSH